ncbi:MAG: DUF3795 domain-containing protein [Clostridia bacterium]|nr:DUF3795 domain-containing protein [Clostridia bacterium]
MKKKVVAPCGIDCFNCELYEENVTEEFRLRIAAATHIPKEKISCAGCINGNQCLFLELEGKKCKTLCCVEQKKVDYCFQCDSFPCEYLMPLSDNAGKFPQNIKLYNLCLMKKIGVEAWTEQASDIRKTYFGKKLAIGEGGSKP